MKADVRSDESDGGERTVLVESGQHNSEIADGGTRMGPTDPPFQFRLVHLLAFMAVVAVFLAAIGYAGFWGAWWFFLFGSFLLGLYFRDAWLWAGGPVACLIVGGLVFPALAPPKPHGRRPQCGNRLRQIGYALASYHATYGCYPPAYVADANGKPMHSWRVLLLPFVEEQQLYKEYDFAEPWDGPNNRRLHDRIVSLYVCPSDPGWKSGRTGYVAVVGGTTMWPGAEAVTRQQCPDGLSNTVLLVEVKNSGIHWMEPRDLDLTTMPLKVNGNGGISSGHDMGANVLYADSRVGFVPDTASPRELRALLTRNGSEKVDPTWK